jgi:hypothetical protein|tara:strand:- start:248 stop:478 length:231 start_codon:yes stop_codon:yes gene_type:complete
MSIDLTFFEVTDTQKQVANLGRKMMEYSENYKDSDIPLEILNAMSRVGENLAENAYDKVKLDEIDTMVVKYARRVL